MLKQSEVKKKIDEKKKKKRRLLLERPCKTAAYAHPNYDPQASAIHQNQAFDWPMLPYHVILTRKLCVLNVSQRNRILTRKSTGNSIASTLYMCVLEHFIELSFVYSPVLDPLSLLPSVTLRPRSDTPPTECLLLGFRATFSCVRARRPDDKGLSKLAGDPSRPRLWP